MLVEKAKTTPEQYPLSLNAICAGANQKNNRDPVTELTTDQIEESLERLRQLGAVTEIQGSGRVARYRHQAYAWLGVEKVELAVLAELLLRGPQTVGQLRGRAVRMEPIVDLASLQPHLDALRSKGLAVLLTPEGRGCIVTHALYPPAELDAVRRKFAEGGSVALDDVVPAGQSASQPPPAARHAAGPASSPGPEAADFASLRARHGAAPQGIRCTPRGRCRHAKGRTCCAPLQPRPSNTSGMADP